MGKKNVVITDTDEGIVVTGVPSQEEIKESMQQQFQQILSEEVEGGPYPEEFKRICQMVADGKLPWE